jgi:hypothetical protein
MMARYTAFIPLYPVGVAGEMWCLYKALPTLKVGLLDSAQTLNQAKRLSAVS